MISDPLHRHHKQILIDAVDDYGAMANLSMITTDNINATLAYQKLFILGDMLQVESPNWYFGSDRTLYVAGGPTIGQIYKLREENRTLIDLSDGVYKSLRVVESL